ncbi:sulfotransferase [Sedimentitalea sp. HM32M-2]|uniref:sulfotransferase n=1 Tax=Sedimentitalea sp. HM32M-2 TaxID=3351566 RepID=UPI0036263DDB
MSDPADPQALRARIEAARALLAEHDGPAALTPRLADPLPRLIEQCRAAAEAVAGREAEPLRTLHHFACTGGTVIARHLAVQPNTILLSEIDPFSRTQVDGMPLHFAPTDLIRHLRYSAREIPEPVIGAVFLGALAPLQAHCRASGSRLVLRDHAHSQFCHGTAPHDHPTLRGLLLRAYPVRSVVTVRHPLESWLSLRHNGWVHFAPATLEEYARRYLAFLAAYAGVELVRYEDFVADPEARLEALCTTLELPFAGLQEELLDLMPLTGGSGRTGRKIAARPRRAVPPEVAEQAAQSPQYAALCARLGYDPAP